jgi:hypothetical protein
MRRLNFGWKLILRPLKVRGNMILANALLLGKNLLEAPNSDGRRVPQVPFLHLDS